MSRGRDESIKDARQGDKRCVAYIRETRLVKRVSRREARGLSFDAVLVPGLAEKMFLCLSQSLWEQLRAVELYRPEIRFLRHICGPKIEGELFPF
jgi:hypothetical protein